MIPTDTQKRSKRLPDAFTSISEHYTLCYCVSYCKGALRHPFWLSPDVGKNDFLPEKTQERKGFIYDDCL